MKRKLVVYGIMLIVLVLGGIATYKYNPEPVALKPIPRTVTTSRPQDCDWDYAPLGRKKCHYKAGYTYANGVYYQYWVRVKD